MKAEWIQEEKCGWIKVSANQSENVVFSEKTVFHLQRAADKKFLSDKHGWQHDKATIIAPIQFDETHIQFKFNEEMLSFLSEINPCNYQLMFYINGILQPILRLNINIRPFSYLKPVLSTPDLPKSIGITATNPNEEVSKKKINIVQEESTARPIIDENDKQKNLNERPQVEEDIKTEDKTIKEQIIVDTSYKPKQYNLDKLWMIIAVLFALTVLVLFIYHVMFRPVPKKPPEYAQIPLMHYVMRV